MKKQHENMAPRIRAVSSMNVPSVTLFPLVEFFSIIVGRERTANMKLKNNSNDEHKTPYTVSEIRAQITRVNTYQSICSGP